MTDFDLGFDPNLTELKSQKSKILFFKSKSEKNWTEKSYSCSDTRCQKDWGRWLAHFPGNSFSILIYFSREFHNDARILGTITRFDRDSKLGRGKNEARIRPSWRSLRSYRWAHYSIFSVSLRFHPRSPPTQHDQTHSKGRWKDYFSDTDYDYPQSSQNISRNNHYASSSVVQRHSRAAHLYRQGSYSTFRAGTKVRLGLVFKKAIKQLRDVLKNHKL